MPSSRLTAGPCGNPHLMHCIDPIAGARIVPQGSHHLPTVAGEHGRDNRNRGPECNQEHQRSNNGHHRLVPFPSRSGRLAFNTASGVPFQCSLFVLSFRRCQEPILLAQPAPRD